MTIDRPPQGCVRNPTSAVVATTSVGRTPTLASLGHSNARAIRITTQTGQGPDGGKHPVRRSGQAVAKGIRSRIRSAACTDLRVEVVDVALDGAQTQDQYIGDLAVTMSNGDES
jgi:hypothetical protein